MTAWSVQTKSGSTYVVRPVATQPEAGFTGTVSGPRSGEWLSTTATPIIGSILLIGVGNKIVRTSPIVAVALLCEEGTAERRSAGSDGSEMATRSVPAVADTPTEVVPALSGL